MITKIKGWVVIFFTSLCILCETKHRQPTTLYTQCEVKQQMDSVAWHRVRSVRPRPGGRTVLLYYLKKTSRLVSFFFQKKNQWNIGDMAGGRENQKVMFFCCCFLPFPRPTSFVSLGCFSHNPHSPAGPIIITAPRHATPPQNQNFLPSIPYTHALNGDEQKPPRFAAASRAAGGAKRSAVRNQIEGGGGALPPQSRGGQGAEHRGAPRSSSPHRHIACMPH